jgi:hypothetical protein
MELIWIWLSFAVFGAVLAKRKHRSLFGWFLAGLVGGPLGLVVGLLPKGGDGNSVRETHDAGEVTAREDAETALYEIKAKSLRRDWDGIKKVIVGHFGDVPDVQVVQNDAEAVIATAGSARITATHELRKKGAYITVATVGIDAIDFGDMASRVTTPNDSETAPEAERVSEGADRPKGKAAAHRTAGYANT